MRVKYYIILLFCIVSFLLLSSGCLNVLVSAEDRYIPEKSENNFSIAFLDVGHGDAAVIMNGNKTMIVDTGRVDRSGRVIDYLRKNNIEYIDYLVITHPHLDHDGGVGRILQYCDVGKVYGNENISRYDTIYMGDDINITVIHPFKGKKYSNTNEGSVTLMIEKNDIRFLLTGDIERVAEHELLRENIDVDADIIKVAHHGSLTSSSYEFISEVTPEFAVVSAGESYTQPDEEVVEIFEDIIGTSSFGEYPVFVTRNDGNIIIETSEIGKYMISTSRTNECIIVDHS